MLKVLPWLLWRLLLAKCGCPGALLGLCYASVTCSQQRQLRCCECAFMFVSPALPPYHVNGAVASLRVRMAL